VWFQIWAAWLNTIPVLPSTISSSDLPRHWACSGVPTSSFSFVTYAWWCFP